MPTPRKSAWVSRASDSSPPRPRAERAVTRLHGAAVPCSAHFQNCTHSGGLTLGETGRAGDVGWGPSLHETVAEPRRCGVEPQKERGIRKRSVEERRTFFPG